MDRTELVKSGKYYTYGHYLDGNLIYIGEGSKYRAWTFNSRPYRERREEVQVRIFGIFDSKELAVFNEGLLIYQERMENNVHLLNKSDYGCGSRGCQHSEETKKKMSEAKFGRQLSEETKKKMSEANIGRQFSEETKKKMSEAKLGRQLSEETRKKLSESQIGEKCYNFKGLVIGTNKDNKIIVFCGRKDMLARGFNPGNISQVILENRSQHKGFKFTRTDDADQLRIILNTSTFYDDVSRQRIEEFLQ